MTQKEKELLLKDLCARLLYGVKFSLGDNNLYMIKGVDLIVTDEGNWEYVVTAKGIEAIEIKYVKPYLRPMSSMTEEQKKEFDQLLELELKAINDEIDPMQATIFEVDFYNKHHLDWRGLIPKDLALEAPKDMYKF